MKHLRLFGLGAAALAFAGQSLIGQTRPAPSVEPGGSPFDTLHFRSIGPASMSGRISDIAVYEANPAIFYVGTAHGGLWKTTNNGTTFDAQFQNQGLISIGDVAVSPSNPDLVWVGTGESNNRQSTSWGDGVYKSTDGGKTWAHVGLKTSRYINRIVIDPRATDTVLVAATGSLWGPGGERGVYKTTDGGKTWKQVLKVDDDTGANDLVMDPDDSKVVYASTYQRRRTACCMNGGGPGSGLWKSTDGGDTWTRLKSGIPEGPLGRIAVDVYRKRPNVLYALIEGPASQGRGGRGAPGRGAAPAAAAQFGRGGGGPLNDEPTGLYRSDDSGATWKKVNNANPRPMYFSQVRIDPNDPEVVYLGGVGLHQTTDGGKTIQTDVARPIHDDVHAIWIDPSNSSHVIIGNDGGLAYSYDMAKTWVFVPNLPVGLFYHVSYDMATPYNVCGGMQDNYDWCGPSAVRGAAGIANYQWQTLQGGDGFVVLQDPTDYRVVYSETQDGNMVRVDRVTGETVSIRPQPAAGEPALRWHWDTPLVLSPQDHKVIYAAAQKVFRSADRGLTWTAISPDLTNDVNRDEVVTMGLKGSDIAISKNDGISAFSTIVQFAESPKRAGLYYAGTDDGNVQVSRDAGKTWTNVASKIPDAPRGGFVSEVVPSRFDEGTVYVTFDDHRQDNFDTYVYVSSDFGQTFRVARVEPEGRSRQDDDRGPEEPRCAVRRHRDRPVCDDRPRPDVEPAEGELPHRTRGRDHPAPARQRDDRRDARPRDLDPRSPRTDPGVRRGPGDHGRREAVLDAAGRDVSPPGARSQLRVLGRSELLRREPAAGGRHLLVQQEGCRRRELEDHGRAQSRRARDLRTGAGQVEQGRAPGGVLGSARATDPAAGRPRRSRPRRSGRQGGAGEENETRTRLPSGRDAAAAAGAAVSAAAVGAAHPGRSCCPASTTSRSSSTARRSRRSRCA